MSISKVKKHILKKWRQHFKKAPQVRRTHQQITSSSLSQNALKVIKQLHRSGYAAYLVGGGVRDVLVAQKPKDFDVVTDANPEQIRKVFPRSRIIGRRFRLVHVYFRGEVIEVSTFRASNQNLGKPSSLAVAVSDRSRMLVNDNTYGTIEEDAWRRDFTINALFYNPMDDTLIDYTGGMTDIEQKQIRMIGDPKQRFHEDPIRLLRAIRLAAKLDFGIHPAIEACLPEFARLLYHVPAARILDETIKLFFKGHAYATYRKLVKYDYFAILFPHTVVALASLSQVDAHCENLFNLALKTTDYRFYHNMSLNPGFLFSIFLWPAFQHQLIVHEKKYALFASRLRHAAGQVFAEQNEIFLLSKRIRQMIRSIWILQYHLLKPKKRRVLRILEHRYFRAAIDFLQLRVEAGEPYEQIANWWHNLRMADRETCQDIIAKLEG